MITKHTDNPVAYSNLGTPRPYIPNYDFEGYIDANHEWYARCETDGICIKGPMTGWLQSADALKLYELAYYAGGDILELGTAYGLSTSVLSQALRASGRNSVIETVELDGAVSKAAKANLKKLQLADRVSFNIGSAETVCEKFKKKKRQFSFAFIDHSHAYWPVYRSNLIMRDLIAPEGLCLFHDYNDPRNTAEKHETDSMGIYGVFAAISDTYVGNGFSYIGSYGCCGLFQKH